VLVRSPPPSTSATSTLSLHDALPICPAQRRRPPRPDASRRDPPVSGLPGLGPSGAPVRGALEPSAAWSSVQTGWWERTSGEDPRSEEHTSELQSRFDLVCRLLLEKKK